MADPLTIVGATGTIFTIVDVLCKAIHTIQELVDEWKEADSTLMNLAAQLSALKAALIKLEEWTNAEVENPHHQLAMDLDVSVSCCRMLVGKISTWLAEMQKTGKSLDVVSKVKLVLHGSDMHHLQKMIERQTNALTLLLTACNW